MLTFTDGRPRFGRRAFLRAGALSLGGLSLPGLLAQAVLENPHVEDAETIAQRYLNIFGDRFFIEIGTYPAVPEGG